ncbi:MAG: hypothetical protein R6V45_04320, partial [Oceanipulchritudo sp.]
MNSDKVQSSWVRDFYDADRVVDHYRQATANIGLWRSEERVFRSVFGEDDRLLELGTGTGRIALGLEEAGYRHIMGL